MSKKYVYLFSEGNGSMRELLGGKGANLAEMTNLGLPVPQGFTITTEACTQYYEDGQKINDEIQAQIMEYIGKMEEIVGKKFGDLENPLLVSVRSGARASMPGMMDTILNLGLNEDVVEVMAKKSGNPRWAYDCYRRFIQMYSDVVMEVGKKYFEELIDKMKEEKGVTQDVELTAEDLKTLAGQFKAKYKEKIGAGFGAVYVSECRPRLVEHAGWRSVDPSIPNPAGGSDCGPYRRCHPGGRYGDRRRSDGQPGFFNRGIPAGGQTAGRPCLRGNHHSGGFLYDRGPANLRTEPLRSDCRHDRTLGADEIGRGKQGG